MDPLAICDTITEMWVRIENKLTQLGFDAMSEENKTHVFEQAVDVYQTVLINQSKKDIYSKPAGTGGSGPTQKQKELILKLGGDPDTIKSMREASDWIEKHKDW